MSSNVEFELRSAKAKDMLVVTDMIRTMVAEENMPHGPKVTCADMIKDGFHTKTPLFRCLVAQICDGGPIIGFAVYYYFFSGRNGRGIKVDDMLVVKEHRKNGIGKAMFNTICKQALENECDCLEFQVLEWNPCRSFYRKCGAVEIGKRNQWCLYRISGDIILNAASEACTTS